MSDSTLPPANPVSTRIGRQAAGDDSPLTPAMEIAAAMIASGSSRLAAANAAGANEWTVRNWMKTNPEFRRAVRQFRRETIDAGLGRISDAIAEAADTLRALLKHPSPRVQLEAAEMLLNRGLGEIDRLEFVERLDAVTGGEVTDADAAAMLSMAGVVAT